MHEKKPTGKLDPKQGAALERQIEQAKSSYMPSIVRHEDDGSMTKMTLATVESVKNMQAEIDSLRQRCSDLKHALGEDAGWFDRAISAEKRAKELGDALCTALVAIDSLIEARPMLAACMCGTTTLGNVRAEIKAVING
jgi:hypothetical protein